MSEDPPRTHNNPPDPIPEPTPIDLMVAELRRANEDLIARAMALLKAGERFPNTIDDRDTSAKATTFSTQLKALLDTADARRKEKGREIREFIAACDGFFASEITGKLDELRAKVREANQDYLDREDAAQRERDRLEREESRKRAEALAAEAAAKLEAAKTDQEVAVAMQTSAAAEQATATVQARDAAPPPSTSVKAASGARAGLSKITRGFIVDRDKIDWSKLAPHLKADDIQKAVNAWVKAQGDTLGEGLVLGGGVEVKKVSQLNERGA